MSLNVYTFIIKVNFYCSVAVRNFRVWLKVNLAVCKPATGYGKTAMALWLVAARRQPVLIIVHTKELLYQWRDRIRQFLKVEAGLIGDGHFEIREITVAIVNSAKKHLEELPGRVGHLIIDECHRCPSKTFTEMVKPFDCKHIMGLSATPYRRDRLDKVIYFFLGPIVHTVDKRELLDSGSVPVRKWFKLRLISISSTRIIIRLCSRL